MSRKALTALITINETCKSRPDANSIDECNLLIQDLRLTFVLELDLEEKWIAEFDAAHFPAIRIHDAKTDWGRGRQSRDHLGHRRGDVTFVHQLAAAKSEAHLMVIAIDLDAPISVA